MKPKLQHKEAMEFSFQAKLALAEGDFLSANDLYAKAAEKEGELAKFYFDKPELEPTRSVIIRSAAYLNLKAGLLSEAQHLIFWGLLNLADPEIKQQLEVALELSIALKNIDFKTESYNEDYFRLLRLRSVNYSMEPSHRAFSNLVSLEMLKDFASEYLKSLRAYANAAFIRAESLLKKLGSRIDDAAEEFEELVNPLITTSGIGSFTFAIANDFLPRGEERELTNLKSNILINYHEKIFINPLNDAEIGRLKREYKDEEINQIFRPVTRIKSSKSSYKVSYFDNESFQKKPILQIARAQKKKLLPLTPPSLEDIGVLESFIVHARKLNDGKKRRNVIQKEQLKTYELEFKTNQIEPKDMRPLLLNQEVIIDVDFDAAKGFTFSYQDLNIDHTDTDYNKGLHTFYSKFYSSLVEIIRDHSREPKNTSEWKKVLILLANPEALLK